MTDASGEGLHNDLISKQSPLEVIGLSHIYLTEFLYFAHKIKLNTWKQHLT